MKNFMLMKWFKKPVPVVEPEVVEEPTVVPPTLREVLQEAVEAALGAYGDKVKNSKLFQKAAVALESGSDAKMADVLVDMLAFNWSRPDLPEADEAGLCKIMEALLAYRRSLAK